MLTAFDIGVGILVLISAILAAVRGLTREVLSLATWAGSAGIAAYIYFAHREDAVTLVQTYVKGLNDTVAAIGVVVVVSLLALTILHLITMKIADWVVDSRIGPLDRTLGFLFGGARGLLICIVVVVFGTWLLASDSSVRALEQACTTFNADLGNGGATSLSTVEQACQSYASLPATDPNKQAERTAFLRICRTEAAGQDLVRGAPLDDACRIYASSPSGLPSWVAEAQTYEPLLQGGNTLIRLLPDDLEQQVTDIISNNRLRGGESQGADEGEAPETPETPAPSAI